jgi:hypothetical protein
MITATMMQSAARMRAPVVKMVFSRLAMKELKRELMCW